MFKLSEVNIMKIAQFNMKSERLPAFHAAIVIGDIDVRQYN